MQTDLERACNVVKSVRDDEVFNVPSNRRWRLQIAAALAQARRDGFEAGVRAAMGEVTGIWGADLVTTQEACEKLLETNDAEPR